MCIDINTEYWSEYSFNNLTTFFWRNTLLHVIKSETENVCLVSHEDFSYQIDSAEKYSDGTRGKKGCMFIWCYFYFATLWLGALYNFGMWLDE